MTEVCDQQTSGSGRVVDSEVVIACLGHPGQQLVVVRICVRGKDRKLGRGWI